MAEEAQDDQANGQSNGQDDNVVYLTTDNFNTTLEEAGDTPVLVDFYADWCGPCRMAAPIIKQLSNDYDGKAIIAKVDVDEHNELAQEYGVMSIPTVKIFKSGEEVDSRVGFAGEEGYTSMIDKALE